MTTTDTSTNAPTGWTPGSWRQFPAAQQPDWPDESLLESTLDTMRTVPPLVFAGEVRHLSESLERVAMGEGFLLQAGDCAEAFAAFNADAIRDKLKVILQMAVALTYSAGVPVVKVGRIAGQFAKPRSEAFETRDDISLPSYRGDLVNDFTFNVESRRPNPLRLLQGYHQAASTLNLLRAFTKGGFADLSRVHAWNLEFVANSPQGRRYEQLANEIDRALRFMEACGIRIEADSALHEADFFTSHEALILGYEEALTRVDSLTGHWYDCSAHLVWLGERTRQVDGAHVEFLSGIHNPIGVKLGPSARAEDAIALCDRLNPTKRPGRLVIVSRMGADKVSTGLPPLLEGVKRAGHPVVWACDPMHGNTFKHESGYKTRRFDDVMSEVRGFFDACHAADVWPGGMHIELTGDDVTECLGGADEIAGADLERRYETVCDPRLNAGQALELAFQVAELLKS